jgi:SPP1 gp7 family putative phage head morphogenesis protein
MARPRYRTWIDSLVDTAVQATEEGRTPARYPDSPGVETSIKRLVHYAMIQGMWLTELDIEEHREAFGRSRHKGQSESVTGKKRVNGAMQFADSAQEDELGTLRKKLSQILSDNIITSSEWQNVVPVEAVNWLDRYTPILAGVLDDSILKKVNSVIQGGMRSGDTLKERVQALKDIGDTMKHMSDSRLRSIARTEITRADNMGRLISMYRNEEVLGVEFCAVMDERTTDICRDRDGMILDLYDPRIVANTPPLHVNCRSVWISATYYSHPDGIPEQLEEKYEYALEEEPGLQREQDVEEVRALIESLQRMENTPAASANVPQGRQEEISGETIDVTGDTPLMMRGILKDRKPSVITFAKSQEIVDELIERQLPSIHFSKKPEYNTRIKDNGRVNIERETGKVTRFLIGKQDHDSEEFLLETLLHEELEARIADRAIRLSLPEFQKMLGKTKPTHAYINKIILRYFAMRGWRVEPWIGKR